MTKYIAFLRGINVGGNNIIKMDRLREEFEKMGFLSVKTYIQSGNVIFQSELTDKIKIEKVIEKALASAFKYEAKVLVRSKKDMENTISHFPNIFQNPDWKHNVIFLSSAIDSKDILDKFVIKKDIEQLSYVPGVLFWSAELKTITRSSMLKLSARKEYKEMTVRNLNTTRKILELMKN
jgi:uncharacterized protein (DUF1697 family)